MQIVSLFDYTGEALKPWAEVGFECFAYDIQHTGAHRDGISFLHADLHDSATVRMMVERPGLGVPRVYRPGDPGVRPSARAADGLSLSSGLRQPAGDPLNDLDPA